MDERKERRGEFLLQVARLVHQEATAATLETEQLAAIPQAARTPEQQAQAMELAQWLRGLESVALVAGVLIAEQGEGELAAAAAVRALCRPGAAHPVTRVRAPLRRRAKAAPK